MIKPTVHYSKRRGVLDADGTAILYPFDHPNNELNGRFVETSPIVPGGWDRVTGEIETTDTIYKPE